MGIGLQCDCPGGCGRHCEDSDNVVHLLSSAESDWHCKEVGEEHWFQRLRGAERRQDYTGEASSTRALPPSSGNSIAVNSNTVLRWCQGAMANAIHLSCACQGQLLRCHRLTYIKCHYARNLHSSGVSDVFGSLKRKLPPTMDNPVQPA